ncbi:MAG: BTAD domain-containing putative transcriptional regulator [Gammaproteobacteria bacterium]|nr:BTAD domain-containing putative transcriptional regulator [Gammaproteobacteria bacterium]
MAHLSLSLLGTPRLLLDEKSLDDDFYEKVESLLAYLAVENNRPHRREVLAELFWPELSDDHARSNLRYALFKLRQGLEEKNNKTKFLITNRTSIRFNPKSEHYLDVSELSNAVSNALRSRFSIPIEKMEHLISLYRGDFMDQSTLTENELFYEWLVNKREIFHRYALILLSKLVEKYADEGEYEIALHHAHRFIELDPLDESGYHKLIQLLTVTGKNTKAIEAYNNLSHLLGMELGIKPNEESTDLIRQLLIDRTNNITIN